MKISSAVSRFAHSLKYHGNACGLLLLAAVILVLLVSYAKTIGPTYDDINLVSQLKSSLTIDINRDSYKQITDFMAQKSKAATINPSNPFQTPAKPATSEKTKRP